MPTYCYRRSDTGELVEITMTIAEKEKLEDGDRSIVLEDGVTATRDITADCSGFVHTPGNWPRLSDALGTHPDQIAEVKRVVGMQGVKTDYTEDGSAVITSQRHQNALAGLYGLHDTTKTKRF